MKVRRDDRGHGLLRLGALVLLGLGVYSRCHRCGHDSSLDPHLLAAEWGPALPIAEVGARLRCPGCGSRDVATRPDWPALAHIADEQRARLPRAVAAE
ncbi:MAG: hypothetical protein QNJ94_12190 [Alphaproteobacteria bacterium]|nr:hypothetical protein [Alphaproteobacteria bacterium]